MRWVALPILVGLGMYATSSLAAPSQPPKAQWIVVLGAAQYNGHPSEILRNRLEAAWRLYQQGKAPKIALTGGSQPGDSYSEGGVGCSYMRARGIPKGRLFCETQSTSTWENLNNIASVVGKERLIIVTDEPHLPRALILAEQLGLNATGYAVKGQFKDSYWQRESWLAILARLGLR